MPPPFRGGNKMTVEKALAKFKRLYPGSVYTDEDLISWLSIVDGRVYNDIILTHEGHEDVTFEGYTSTTPTSTVLLIPEPYSEAYIYYLMAMSEMHNGESERNANSTAMFNNEYNSFAAYYNSNNKAARYYNIKIEGVRKDELPAALQN